MTIDPTKFEAQGKPTRDQARVVWDGMANPSCRKVANELINRGYDASWRTIARWSASDWRPAVDQKGTSKATRKPMAERGRAKGFHQAIKEELSKIPPHIVKEADQLALQGPKPLTLDEYALVAKRRDELQLLPDRELDAQEARARKIMNILIAEQAAQRAHIMVLVPKDTGALVGALAEAQRVSGVNIDATGPNDPRVVEGRAIPDEPANPLSSAIGKFLSDIEAA